MDKFRIGVATVTCEHAFGTGFVAILHHMKDVGEMTVDEMLMDEYFITMTPTFPTMEEARAAGHKVLEVAKEKIKQFGLDDRTLN